MPNYESKEALIAEIQKMYKLFDQEFDEIPEQQKDLRIPEVDRTPQEMLAYQLGWLTLVTGWEKDERAGKEVITPSPDYKWNQLGPLYQHFYETYQGNSLAELRDLFKQNVEELCQWIGLLSEKELFQPGVRKWTVTTVNWPMSKWIQINSVAPFKSFRTKIRKWKKTVNNTK
ncbi:ClbS/DfsB family four-helix bundle protein [Paenibacillus albidus]|uniref:ClbS/DfsB family four-helix bundle protein n=1 Tax=Paenibacillus albidus TaxID=2041023 RepID=UPI001BE6C440|nr:ClbS/DfsB family four-helix bundle protein [Paenibacillus albidus]MBT2291719.1 ClbS/DfsB family four-helix bundle protein [Paenibacillus albidus]